MRYITGIYALQFDLVEDMGCDWHSTNLLLDGSPNNLIEKENNIKILEEEKKVKKPNIKDKTL